MDTTEGIRVPSLGPASAPSDRAAAWLDYPLSRALRERRSRRVGLGMEIPGGPLAYRSDRPPLPLSEQEEAILAFAACGITGPSLSDWDFAAGGNMMAGLVGRTVSSADGIQNTAVFVIQDEATYLARRPRELEPATLTEAIRLTTAGEFLEAWRLTRVRIADRRCTPPVAPPYNVNANRWQLFAAGTTYFLPVGDLTFLLINVLLDLLGEESGFYPIDERNLYRPAGVARFARSRGGHLDDDPRGGKTAPISIAERNIAEMAAVEMGMSLQNLGLACDALGLGGTPTYAGEDDGWFPALDFRMAAMPVSRFFGLPALLRLGLRIQRQDVSMRYPVGLEHEGEVLLRPFCPPYYPSMAAAVRAVVDLKFGEGGVFRGGSPSAWRAADAVARAVPAVSERAVDATIAYCEYVWGRYGRFPATYPPFHVLMGFQAHHVDEAFYDRFYQPTALAERHRRHREVWHGAPGG